MRTSQHRRRTGLGFLATLVLGVASVAPGLLVQRVGAATGIAEFGKPTAESSFATGVTFSQPVTINQGVRRAELLLTVADAAGPTVIPVPMPSGTGTGAIVLSHLVDPSVDGHMLPNTPLAARWRLVAADDPTDVEIGPEVQITYADDRFKWRTEAGALVRVHWYEGTTAFGARALKIGEDAVRQASDLLQVAETDPIDFFVYADQDKFYDALGPGTRENVGGQSNAEIRTMFALIPTDEIDQPWVGTVIPHELTHLVFDTASRNPYHFPPRWLNEGLAVYVSQGYDPSDRRTVEDAGGAGTLIPLDGLTGQFPTSYERFSLAYAESVSAVDYLIRAHTRDSLVSLIRSYARGLTDSEAFSAALGLDMSAFGAAWLADLGAASPTRYGPQTAPPGPIPSAWLVRAGASGPPAASAGPDAASPGTSAAPGNGAPAADSSGLLLVVLAAAIAIVVLVAGLAARRRRTPPGSDG